MIIQSTVLTFQHTYIDLFDHRIMIKMNEIKKESTLRRITQRRWGDKEPEK